MLFLFKIWIKDVIGRGNYHSKLSVHYKLIQKTHYGWRLAFHCKCLVMPSPLVILASLSVVVGILGSVFILLAISVDSWEEIDFSVVEANSSTLQVTPAASRSDVTVYEELGSGTYYFLYYQYGGPWKLCDLLTGKYCDHHFFCLTVFISWSFLSI